MYLFRADGNAKIGAGHLMRCLTIAQALRRFTKDILFLCADASSAALVEKQGFPVRVLGTDYHRMEEELPRIGRLLPQGLRHTFLVDSYQVTDAYLEGLKTYGCVFLLDDMQKHVYPADGVINYNIYARRECYEERYRGRDTGLYIGADYVPVRQQFQKTGQAYQPAERVRDILITTGGGDQDNIAGAILEAIYCDAYRYHLVIGSFNPHRPFLQAFADAHPGVFLHCDVQDMAGLMADCQLAVTAGGTTVYELSALGVPFVCFSYAENQEALTAYIEEHKIAGYAGAYHRDPEGTLKQITDQLRELSDNFPKRKEYWKKERQLIDGQGAERIARVLLKEE